MDPFFLLFWGFLIYLFASRQKLNSFRSRWKQPLEWAKSLEPEKHEKISTLFIILYGREALIGFAILIAAMLTQLLLLGFGTVILRSERAEELIPYYFSVRACLAALACWLLISGLLRVLILRRPLKERARKLLEIIQDPAFHPTLETLKARNPEIQNDITSSLHRSNTS